MPKNITIQRLVSILLQRIKFIVLITLIATLSFFLYSKLFVTPMYSTSAMIFVQNYNAKGGANDEYQKIYGSDIAGSSSMAAICVTLFQNSDEMTSLYNGCSVDISVSEETFFITFNVNGADPQKCADVANQVSKKAEEVFKKYFAYGQIGTIREAHVPSSPYEPNNIKNATVGFAVGLVAAIGFSILLELIDSTVKPGDDLQSLYDIPVFAEIPDFANLN
ncbi:MAG: Wzz/FepE/Etk N-terminal domain-containing protein [Ruminococcus sp.]|nr:Wzz/FepE/Etk N-terminal domain-containing protein [Ruminococcus sp.]